MFLKSSSPSDDMKFSSNNLLVETMQQLVNKCQGEQNEFLIKSQNSFNDYNNNVNSIPLNYSSLATQAEIKKTNRRPITKNNEIKKSNYNLM
jgi:hypothetical protein